MRRLLVLALVLAVSGCGSSTGKPHVVRVAAEVDVSNARDDQSEVSVAASPNGRVLLAGSNEFRGYPERAYSSVDGGRSWVSRLEPPLPHPAVGCATDPAVAIDATGREYFAFLEYRPCEGNQIEQSLYVATRPEAGAPWFTRRRPLAARSSGGDDHPAIAVDRSRLSPHRGRVYVAWARQAEGISGVVVSHSDDNGRTWSPLATVSDSGANEYDASIAVGRRGEVYVSWLDLDSGTLFVDESRDGVVFGTDRTAAVMRERFTQNCGVVGFLVVAQARRCVRPSGTLSTDTSDGARAGRVYFTYSDSTPSSGQDVFVDVFDSGLHALLGYAAHGRPHRVTPAEGTLDVSDQFLPVSAVDEHTGDLWICFYDTANDKSRYTTQFSCVASVDGAKTFTPPFRAASRFSDESVRQANVNQYGDYEGLAVAAGLAHPAWTDTRRRSRSGDEIFTTTLRLTSSG